MRDWAAAQNRNALPDADFVEEFVSSRFGPQHHLTSLTRYALHLPNDGNNEVAAAAFDPDQQYQLDAKVRLLTGMHDCEALIERIRLDSTGAGLFAESELSDRVTYVLTSSATAYRIDPDSQALLSLFEQPRSCREVTDLVAEVSGVDGLSSSYFAPFIDAGILISRPAVHPE
jgi:hypothetical protein